MKGIGDVVVLGFSSGWMSMTLPFEDVQTGTLIASWSKQSFRRDIKAGYPISSANVKKITRAIIIAWLPLP